MYLNQLTNSTKKNINSILYVEKLRHKDGYLVSGDAKYIKKITKYPKELFELTDELK